MVSKPGVLSFAGGFPAPELFPRIALGDSFARVLETDPGALQYGPQLPALTEHIVTIMERRGVRCSAEQILVTSGAQQGIRILTELLLRERRPVLLEQVVYTGLTTALASYDPEIRVVRSDSEDGLDPDDLLKQLENDAACAFLYVVPDAQNPSGTSLPISSRQRIVELAVRYEVPIIEDDPYGFLLYDGEPLPPLSALDADWVFYLGSFSKIISPALRLGWMVVPPEAAITKDAIDLESSGLMQRVVSDYLDGNDLFERIAELRATYRRRRDAMLEALDEFFPSSARWNHPRGGFFVWVELGEKSDTTELLERSWRRRASRSCRARPSRSAVLELLIACD